MPVLNGLDDDDDAAARFGSLWSEALRHSAAGGQRGLIWDAAAALAKTNAFDRSGLLSQALASSSFSSIQPIIDQLYKDGNTPFPSSAVQQVFSAMTAQSTASSWLSQLASLDAFSAATEQSTKARDAVDAAAEELHARQPSISRATARRLVVVYAYLLGISLILTLAVIQPELMKLWLAAGGVNAWKLGEVAGKAFDQVVPVEDQEP